MEGQTEGMAKSKASQDGERCGRCRGHVQTPSMSSRSYDRKHLRVSVLSCTGSVIHYL